MRHLQCVCETFFINMYFVISCQHSLCYILVLILQLNSSSYPLYIDAGGMLQDGDIEVRLLLF